MQGWICFGKILNTSSDIVNYAPIGNVLSSLSTCDLWSLDNWKWSKIWIHRWMIIILNGGSFSNVTQNIPNFEKIQQVTSPKKLKQHNIVQLVIVTEALSVSAKFVHDTEAHLNCQWFSLFEMFFLVLNLTGGQSVRPIYHQECSYLFQHKNKPFTAAR